MNSGSSRKARILLWDIETAPIIGTAWQTWQTDLVWIEQDWYMLCFAYKWLGERKTYVVAQTDFKGYKPGSTDDLQVIKELHRVLSEADAVIAHNGDKFDLKKANARFVYHNLGPASPVLQIDTRKMAKKYFGFTSNKLDDLGEYFGVGRKIPTDKNLWRNCMAGDMKAWSRMKRYNAQDVRLLERVYTRLLPFDVSHPNRANIEGRMDACPRCGQQGFLWAQGWRYTKAGKYRRWQCKKCGSYVSERNAVKADKPDYV